MTNEDITKIFRGLLETIEGVKDEQDFSEKQQAISEAIEEIIQEISTRTKEEVAKIPGNKDLFEKIKSLSNELEETKKRLGDEKNSNELLLQKNSQQNNQIEKLQISKQNFEIELNKIDREENEGGNKQLLYQIKGLKDHIKEQTVKLKKEKEKSNAYQLELKKLAETIEKINQDKRVLLDSIVLKDDTIKAQAMSQEQVKELIKQKVTNATDELLKKYKDLLQQNQNLSQKVNITNENYDILKSLLQDYFPSIEKYDDITKERFEEEFFESLRKDEKEKIEQISKTLEKQIFAQSQVHVEDEDRNIEDVDINYDVTHGNFDLQQEIQELEQKNQALQQQKTQLQQQLEKQKTEHNNQIQDLEQQKTDYEKQIEKLKNNLKKNEENHKKQIQALEQQLGNTKTELEQTIQELQQQKTQLQQQLEKKNQEHEKQKTDYEKKIQDLKDQHNQALGDKEAKHQKELKNLEKKLSEKVNKLKNLIASINNLNTKTNKIPNQLSKLQDVLKKQRDQNNNENNTRKNFSREINHNYSFVQNASDKYVVNREMPAALNNNIINISPIKTLIMCTQYNICNNIKSSDSSNKLIETANKISSDKSQLKCLNDFFNKKIQSDGEDNKLYKTNFSNFFDQKSTNIDYVQRQNGVLHSDIKSSDGEVVVKITKTLLNGVYKVTNYEFTNEAKGREIVLKFPYKNEGVEEFVTIHQDYQGNVIFHDTAISNNHNSNPIESGCNQDLQKKYNESIDTLSSQNNSLLFSTHVFREVDKDRSRYISM